MLDQFGRHMQGPLRLMLADVKDGERLVHAFRVIHIRVGCYSGQFGGILSGGRKVGECCGLPRGQQGRGCNAAARATGGGWT